jgi:hypothetical protein
MRRSGAADAITFTPPAEDDGTPIGERLGYTVTRYNGMAFRELPHMPEAEFHATPWGADVMMAVCEPRLPGTLFVSGRRGDGLFNTIRPGSPDLFTPFMAALAGAMMGEFRLRVGFLNMQPYFIVARHPEAIYRITTSPEMKPWSVGGSYDRPILRRILEEAGIPRGLFGVEKRANAVFRMAGAHDMSKSGGEDYMRFRRSMPPLPLWRRYGRRGQRLLIIAARVSSIVRRSEAAQIRARLLRFSPAMTFAFHWGCATTQPRYRIHASADEVG